VLGSNFAGTRAIRDLRGCCDELEGTDKRLFRENLKRELGLIIISCEQHPCQPVVAFGRAEARRQKRV